MPVRAPIFDDDPLSRLIQRGNLEFLVIAEGSNFEGVDPGEVIGSPIDLADNGTGTVTGSPTLEQSDLVLRVDHPSASDTVTIAPANEIKAICAAFKVTSGQEPVTLAVGSQFRLGFR